MAAAAALPCSVTAASYTLTACAAPARHQQQRHLPCSAPSLAGRVMSPRSAWACAPLATTVASARSCAACVPSAPATMRRTHQTLRARPTRPASARRPPASARAMAAARVQRRLSLWRLCVRMRRKRMRLCHASSAWALMRASSAWASRRARPPCGSLRPVLPSHPGSVRWLHPLLRRMSLQHRCVNGSFGHPLHARASLWWLAACMAAQRLTPDASLTCMCALLWHLAHAAGTGTA